MLNVPALFLPIFLLIVLIEWYISTKTDARQYSVGSLLMNISIGAIDQVGSLVYFAALYVALSYVYDHYRLFEIPNSWYLWLLAYVAIDFLSYWYHRLSHEVNILWAGHVTHHSSEKFNFSNGFRTSIFQGFNRIIFWSLLPLLGFPPAVLVLTLKISGLYDFLQHNEYVPRLPWVEKIFITPSLHRVHHGKNDIFIDKNYGSTFSIWDRMFGTFQEETEPVVYGIKGNYTDDSPFAAIGHHYYYLWATMKTTPQWYNKIKLLFMPPDWTPTPLHETTTSLPENKTTISSGLKNYALFQVFFCTTSIMVLLIYKNFVPDYLFLVSLFIGIVRLSKATMIFNKNIDAHFETKERLWLLGEALLISIALLWSSDFLWLYLLMYLLVSMSLLDSALFTHVKNIVSLLRRTK